MSTNIKNLFLSIFDTDKFKYNVISNTLNSYMPFKYFNTKNALTNSILQEFFIQVLEFYFKTFKTSFFRYMNCDEYFLYNVVSYPNIGNNKYDYYAMLFGHNVYRIFTLYVNHTLNYYEFLNIFPLIGVSNYVLSSRTNFEERDNNYKNNFFFNDYVIDLELIYKNVFPKQLDFEKQYKIDPIKGDKVFYGNYINKETEKIPSLKNFILNNIKYIYNIVPEFENKNFIIEKILCLKFYFIESFINEILNIKDFSKIENIIKEQLSVNFKNESTSFENNYYYTGYEIKPFIFFHQLNELNEKDILNNRVLTSPRDVSEYYIKTLQRSTVNLFRSEFIIKNKINNDTINNNNNYNFNDIFKNILINFKKEFNWFTLYNPSAYDIYIDSIFGEDIYINLYNMYLNDNLNSDLYYPDLFFLKNQSIFQDLCEKLYMESGQNKLPLNELDKEKFSKKFLFDFTKNYSILDKKMYNNLATFLNSCFDVFCKIHVCLYNLIQLFFKLKNFCYMNKNHITCSTDCLCETCVLLKLDPYFKNDNISILELFLKFRFFLIKELYFVNYSMSNQKELDSMNINLINSNIFFFITCNKLIEKNLEYDVYLFNLIKKCEDKNFDFFIKHTVFFDNSENKNIYTMFYSDHLEDNYNKFTVYYNDCILKFKKLFTDIIIPYYMYTYKIEGTYKEYFPNMFEYFEEEIENFIKKCIVFKPIVLNIDMYDKKNIQWLDTNTKNIYIQLENNFSRKFTCVTTQDNIALISNIENFNNTDFDINHMFIHLNYIYILYYFYFIEKISKDQIIKYGLDNNKFNKIYPNITTKNINITLIKLAVLTVFNYLEQEDKAKIKPLKFHKYIKFFKILDVIYNKIPYLIAFNYSNIILLKMFKEYNRLNLYYNNNLSLFNMSSLFVLKPNLINILIKNDESDNEYKNLIDLKFLGDYKSILLNSYVGLLFVDRTNKLLPEDSYLNTEYLKSKFVNYFNTPRYIKNIYNFNILSFNLKEYLYYLKKFYLNSLSNLLKKYIGNHNGKFYLINELYHLEEHYVEYDTYAHDLNIMIENLYSKINNKFSIASFNEFDDKILNIANTRYYEAENIITNEFKELVFKENF